MRLLLFLILGFMLVSCRNAEKEHINHLVNEWSGKEIVYPDSMSFVSLGRDTCYMLPKKEYTIVTYVDSIGCTSCKLRLSQWKSLIAKFESVNNTSVILILHPKDKKEMVYILRRDNFTHPVCMDERDVFNKLNKLPKEEMFQTFLLNANNKVVAIGNPVHNPKIEELYFKIITGENPVLSIRKELQTSIAFDKTSADLNTFDWLQEQTVNFMLTNTGKELLLIDGITTSCGCTIVEYSKEPIRVGDSSILKVKYKADHPEYFNKTITVHCNAKESPFQLKICGNAIKMTGVINK